MPRNPHQTPTDTGARSIIDVMSTPHVQPRDDLERHSLERQIGVPLTPTQPIPGTDPIVGARIGIQGNPPGIDQTFSGCWRLVQANDWETYVRLVPDHTNGGYFVLDPVTRFKHHNEMVHLGSNTHADLSDSFLLTFVIPWANGSKGLYNGGSDGVKFSGGTHEEGRPMPNFYWFGEKVQLSDFPRPTTSQNQVQPTISVEARFTTLQDRYNVTVGGAGFKTDDPFVVQGKYIKDGVVGLWIVCAQGTTDQFGNLSANFDVIKPLGSSYVVRVVGTDSGTTPEVGF